MKIQAETVKEPPNKPIGRPFLSLFQWHSQPQMEFFKPSSRPVRVTAIISVHPRHLLASAFELPFFPPARQGTHGPSLAMTDWDRRLSLAYSGQTRGWRASGSLEVKGKDLWYDRRRTGRYDPSEGYSDRLIERALVRMATFIALLRGINVGSNRKLPMADLRDACLKLGFRQPETYIQSGNLIADADIGADEVREQLQAALTQRFGFAVDVVVRDAQAWAAYIAANPFTDGPARMVHLCLSREPIDPTAAEALSERAKSGERLALAGGALWIDYGPSGVARSKLTPSLIDRLCGSPTTGRNWTTVLKLQDMLAARGRSTTRKPMRKRS